MKNILRPLVFLVQIILYIPIQIAFIPLALFGLPYGFIKESRNSRKFGVSFSAGQALQYRWIMHQFSTRPDPLTIKFIRNFPCESSFALWTIMGPLILAQRWFELTTKLGKLVEPGYETLDTTAGKRVIEFDRIFEKYIEEVDQVVLPGAGFDLIAHNFARDKDVRVFELDRTNTMDMKINTLEKAGIEHDRITYIPVDYSKESWSEKLLKSGFDKSKRTLFIWQSVSLYLDEETVKDALREMAGLCSAGSIIAQDFYSKSFASGQYSKIVKKNADMIGKMGEPWIFGIDMSGGAENAVESFLADCGLRMTTYSQFGVKLGLKPFYCIVESEIS